MVGILLFIWDLVVDKIIRDTAGSRVLTVIRTGVNGSELSLGELLKHEGEGLERQRLQICKIKGLSIEKVVLCVVHRVI